MNLLSCYLTPCLLIFCVDVRMYPNDLRQSYLCKQIFSKTRQKMNTLIKHIFGHPDTKIRTNIDRKCL